MMCFLLCNMQRGVQDHFSPNGPTTSIPNSFQDPIRTPWLTITMWGTGILTSNITITSITTTILTITTTKSTTVTTATQLLTVQVNSCMKRISVLLLFCFWVFPSTSSTLYQMFCFVSSTYLYVVCYLLVGYAE